MGVQPMTGPESMIFYMKYRYGLQTCDVGTILHVKHLGLVQISSKETSVFVTKLFDDDPIEPGYEYKWIDTWEVSVPEPQDIVKERLNFYAKIQK